MKKIVRYFQVMEEDPGDITMTKHFLSVRQSSEYIELNKSHWRIRRESDPRIYIIYRCTLQCFPLKHACPLLEVLCVTQEILTRCNVLGKIRPEILIWRSLWLEECLREQLSLVELSFCSSRHTFTEQIGKILSNFTPNDVHACFSHLQYLRCVNVCDRM